MPLFSTQSRCLLAAFAVMAAGAMSHAAHAQLGLGGPTLDSFAHNWVYTAVELIAVAVCGARVVRKRENRWAWALVTIGLTRRRRAACRRGPRGVHLCGERQDPSAECS
jgi:hypothetical protein